MKQFLSAVVFLCCLLGTAITQEKDAPLAGGYSEISLPTDKQTQLSLENAAKFAVDEINARIENGDMQSDAAPPLTYKQMFKAGSSVVAGIKWHMTIATFDAKQNWFVYEIEVVDAPFMPDPMSLVKVEQIIP